MTNSDTESTTPPENPEKSKREWEAFFNRWGGAAREVEEKVITQEDF